MTDEKVKASNSRVNAVVERPEEIITSTADYYALREKWTKQLATPKLMRSADAPSVMDGEQNIKLLLSGEESGGRFMVSLITLEPDTGAPPHHQPNEDEIFLVVSGQVTITIGHETQTVGSGDFAYAPRNTTHAFRAAGGKPAVMFSINSPGGHERGFEYITGMVKNGHPIEEAIAGLKNYDFIIDEIENEDDKKRIGV
ncbi:MAG: cupin domain-containing protein [Xanthomonadales bacterium]|nr:cupin domain-containing protein [Xanthomonadales bacterium]